MTREEIIASFQALATRATRDYRPLYTEAAALLAEDAKAIEAVRAFLEKHADGHTNPPRLCECSACEARDVLALLGAREGKP